MLLWCLLSGPSPSVHGLITFSSTWCCSMFRFSSASCCSLCCRSGTAARLETTPNLLAQKKRTRQYRSVSLVVRRTLMKTTIGNLLGLLPHGSSPSCCCLEEKSPSSSSHRG